MDKIKREKQQRRKRRANEWPEATIKEWQQLTEEGAYAREIAERYGVTRNAVIGALWRARIRAA